MEEISAEKRKLVYIASPYTRGDTGANVGRQVWAAHALMDMGYVPIAPLLNHFLHIARPRAETEWLEADFAILLRCDAVLRLPGESAGADRETALAEKKGIPVVFGVAEFKEWARKQQVEEANECDVTP